MQKDKTAYRVSLLAKIALALNYISKDEFESLLAEIKAGRDAGLEVSETALMKRYVDQADFRRLSRNCRVFDSEQSDKRFGELCIAFGFLTQINLELALEEQKRMAAQGESVPLGTILVDAGMLGSGQRDLILHKQNGFEEEEKTEEKSNVVEMEPPAEDFDLTDFKQIREGGITILIRNDGLEAYITKTQAFDPAMGAEQIQHLLEKHDIIYGLVGKEALAAFIGRAGGGPLRLPGGLRPWMIRMALLSLPLNGII